MFDDHAVLQRDQPVAVWGSATPGGTLTVSLGKELGRRLARAARHVVYGESITPSGPVPVEAHRDGEHVVVTFKDIGGNLVAYGAYRPVGFELCGADPTSCRLVDATLQTDRVILDPAHDSPPPTRVRYGWADSPVCTLYDRDGLPAGPFELPIS